MPFTTPLALLGLLFVPAVIAMYLLKLRRDEAVVPSTLLWTRLVADVEANAPWQRLRRSLLLLLQLLLVIALALLAARPFLERPAGLARDIVLVMDTSASMAATDVVPDRLTAAKQVAIDALKDLPTGGKVSLIAADRTARIVVNESGDLTRVRQAIESIPVTESRGDLGDALELASKLAARSGDAQILVATDAALASKPTGRVAAPVKVLSVGRDRKNQAIVALAVRTAPSAVTRSVFVSVANLDLTAASRRLELWGDDRLLEVRDVKLDPQARSDVIIDDLPREVGTVEVRLVGPDPSVQAAPDQLAVDDRAWAVIPPDRTRLVLVVGEGDPYLETALSFLPDVELFGVTPAEYGPSTERKDGRPWDLVIFEDFLPATLPKTPVLAIAPPRSGPLGDVSGTLKNPGIGTPGSGRARPSLRRSLDHACLRGREAHRTDLGAHGRAGSAWRAAALLGDARGPQQRRPRVRTAPVRPAAPGRIPDPFREPHRRADGDVDRADRSRRPGHARPTAHPVWRGRAVHRRAGRDRDAARTELDRRRRYGRHLRSDRSARDLYRDPDPRP